jgi:hypothetical protein
MSGIKTKIEDNNYDAVMIEEGVVVKLDGKYWVGGSGERSQEFDDLYRAGIHDAKYCTKTTDVVYEGHSMRPLLKKANLKRVVKITTWIVSDLDNN